MESKVLNAIAAYEAEILDFTKEMVNIDSGVDCPEGVRQVAELIKEKLLPLGFKVELASYPSSTAWRTPRVRFLCPFLSKFLKR